jgi:hypothetical protein
MHRHLRLAPLLLLVPATACDRLVQRAFQPPTAEFRGATLRSVGLGGGVVDVQLLLRNPNPYPLTASSASYRVFAGDSVEVGQGITNDTVVVAARDSALVRLPLNVTWRALNAAGRQALADGMVDYMVAGEVVGVTPVGDHTFPVKARGRARIPVPRL